MKKLSPFEREAYLHKLLEQLRNHEMTEGVVLATLRKNILGMNQEDYAALVGVSRKTISDIENDTGKQTLPVMNSVFKPFGLRLGLQLRQQGAPINTSKS
jgi:DNA-binding XRE family transcriptional regulator